MLVLPGIASHQFNLGGGDIPRKDATDAVHLYYSLTL